MGKDSKSGKFRPIEQVFEVISRQESDEWDRLMGVREVMEEAPAGETGVAEPPEDV